MEVCHPTGAAKTTLEVVITTTLDNAVSQIHQPAVRAASLWYNRMHHVFWGL